MGVKYFDKPAPFRHPLDFRYGEQVIVYAFGHWYEGWVSKINKKRVAVTYTNNRFVTRVKVVSPSRPATANEGPSDIGPLIRKLSD